MAKRNAPSQLRSPKVAKRQVSKDYLLKWQRTYERDYQTMTWLRADFEDDRMMVSTLWCEVCRRYEERICTKKNFSKAWIEGSTNYRASNVTDHACSEQHKSAMALLTSKSKSESITTYSSLARSMFSTTLSPAHREQIKKKFEICYLLAKEHEIPSHS